MRRLRSGLPGRLPGLLIAAAAAVPAAAFGDELGLRIFTQDAQPPCALCHTLQAAGSTGAVGPSLDELAPDKARVLEVLRTGSGVMPSYAETLSAEELEAVASFVAQAVRGR